MSSEWRKVTFGELIDAGVLEIGDGYRAKNAELSGGGLIFLRAGHVKDTHIDFTGVDRFGTSEETRFGRKVSLAGDVVITTKGNSTGRIAVVTPDMPQFVYSPHLSYWRTTSEDVITQGFLRAWARSSEFSSQLEGLSRSTDMAPYLSLRDQRRLEITLPPSDVQRTIDRLSDALSARLELLRETNATLEAIAQALFKAWFVDFDPVQAKSQGRQPEGMDGSTAALFPDSFEDSVSGAVPKGWQTSSIEALADLNPESWSAKKHPDRIQYIDLANTKANQVDGLTEFSFDQAPSRARRVLRVGDVIVGTVRPGNRSFARIAQDIAGLTGSTGFAVLRARHEFDRALVYIAATRDEAIERLAHFADGGAYPAVRPELVGSTPLVIPSQELRIAFGEVANPLFAAIGANQEQARVLADIRDTLLPRLISGRLRLPEAEADLTKGIVA